MYRILFKCSVLVLVVMLLADVTKLMLTGESSFLAFYDDVRQGRVMDFGAEHLSLDSPTIPNVELPDISSIKELDVFKGEAEPSLVYKWVDEAGVVHYGSERPSDMDVTEMLVDPNAEHLKLMPQAEFQEDNSSSSSASNLKALGVDPSVTKEGEASAFEAKKLIEDAKNIQQLLDQRSETLESLIEE